ncbi:MAG TPA: A/G-specific adenine glycosylase [Phycisphaerales bacterium]|nr:A/G-specific adenine glycosylase [Phycisphaerales bacterium]|tara:strand:+ start:5125 stop:6207 length:1083 start_codon:yes stop_codon:yes gene_type:complete
MNPPPGLNKLKRQRTLLKWYDGNGRNMPWRSRIPQTPNSYHVLLSEAMLQQTQVATVIDYFNRFITAFPTVHDLADADEQQVLKLWEGLGYYRRARNLHACAKMIVDQHDGIVPNTVDALLKLPGVGRYTAGAIASIAYGVAAPILDGNVVRVLSRWFAITDSTDDKHVKEQLWQLAEQLVPTQRAGDFNQAMMDLGAMICTPKSPACLTCPMAKMCSAYDQGIAETLPKRTPRTKPTTVTHHVVSIERKGQYLFTQRPASGLWSNMWQMPTLEESNEKELVLQVKSQLGLDVSDLQKVQNFKHQTTHRTITFTHWHAGEVSGRLKSGVGQWRKLDQLEDLPLANPQSKVVTFLIKKDLA